MELSLNAAVGTLVRLENALSDIHRTEVSVLINEA
jgi:hypothetical protein